MYKNQKVLKLKVVFRVTPNYSTSIRISTKEIYIITVLSTIIKTKTKII